MVELVNFAVNETLAHPFSAETTLVVFGTKSHADPKFELSAIAFGVPEPLGYVLK